MKIKQVLAVTAVGAAMGLVAKKVKAPTMFAVAAVYVIGVMIGARGARRGWLGLLSGHPKYPPRIAIKG